MPLSMEIGLAPGDSVFDGDHLLPPEKRKQHTHTHTTILQSFSGTTRVSGCQKRTSGLCGARED